MDEELPPTKVSPPAGSRNGAGPLTAIISDIHANLEALEAVVADIRSQGASRIVCLGDIVGYGPQPAPCLEIVRRACAWSLCGNHDAAVFMFHAVGFHEAAARAAAWHRDSMRPGFLSLPGRVANWRWLENLPTHRREGDVLFVHASPRDPLIEYVLEEDFQDVGFGPSEKAVGIFSKFDSLCFVGHSHRPGVATHDLRWIRPADLPNQTYVFPPGQKTLINIGAVGQPRDKDPRSCYVLFDGAQVRFRRVEYDLKETQRKMRAIEALDARLADRLALGM